MGHSAVRCAKMAELIDMLFCWLDPCIRWEYRSPKGKGQFRGLSGPFKSISNLRCSRCWSVAVAFPATGIIQSPIMSCRRDHSICHASANSIRKISGRWQCGLSATKGGGDVIAKRGWSVISTITLLLVCIIRYGLWLQMFYVWHSGELCKNGWTDRDATFAGAGGADSCGSKEPCVRWGSRYPHGKGHSWGGHAQAHCNVPTQANVPA